jgi:hypothetical protein
MAAKPLIGDDNSINSFDGKSDQFTKDASVEQVPFILGIPGPMSLRRKDTAKPYKIRKNNKNRN